MVGILKGDFGGPSRDTPEQSLTKAYQASQRLENGYRKFEIQRAIKDGDAARMAEHARFLDNGYNRYTIEQAAKNLKK